MGRLVEQQDLPAYLCPGTARLEAGGPPPGVVGGGGLGQLRKRLLTGEPQTEVRDCTEGPRTGGSKATGCKPPRGLQGSRQEWWEQGGIQASLRENSWLGERGWGCHQKGRWHLSGSLQPWGG